MNALTHITFFVAGYNACCGNRNSTKEEYANAAMALCKLMDVESMDTARDVMRVLETSSLSGSIGLHAISELTEILSQKVAA